LIEWFDEWVKRKEHKRLSAKWRYRLSINDKPFAIYPVTAKRFLSGLESDSYFERVLEKQLKRESDLDKIKTILGL